MLLKVISCDALRREICAAAARSPHRTDLEFLPAAPDDSAELLRIVQNAVDRASEDLHDAIVLAYALCGKSVAGIESRGVPLIIPRSSECAAFHAVRSGVCFQSSGWTHQDGALERTAIMALDGDKVCAARYTTYRQVTYITTTPNAGPPGSMALEVRLLRDRHDLFDRLLSGEWPETEYLTVPQGWRVADAPDGHGIDREPIA